MSKIRAPIKSVYTVQKEYWDCGRGSISSHCHLTKQAAENCIARRPFIVSRLLTRNERIKRDFDLLRDYMSGMTITDVLNKNDIGKSQGFIVGRASYMLIKEFGIPVKYPESNVNTTRKHNSNEIIEFIDSFDFSAVQFGMLKNHTINSLIIELRGQGFTDNDIRAYWNGNAKYGNFISDHKYHGIICKLQKSTIKELSLGLGINGAIEIKDFVNTI